MIFLLSCGEEQGKEKDIVNSGTMARILVDIHLAEGKVNQAKLPLDTALSYYKFLEGEIYEKYNVDSAAFNKSMRYYTVNIRELDKIYEIVLDSLNLMSTKQDEIEEAEKEKEKEEEEKEESRVEEKS